MSVYRIASLLIMILGCNASHFRGGYITYEPGTNADEIRVSYRVSWRRDSRPHDSCTQEAIDSRRKLWGESYLECESCTDSKIRLGYQCTDLSLEENWVTGIGTHTFKLKDGMDKSFQMKFVDCCWIDLENFGESIGWSIVPHINLNPRPDNGLLNSSPVTSMLPIIRVPKGCNRQITVPVIDPDEDEVRCRWPKAILGECIPEGGRRLDKVACDKPANFELDEMRCKISFDASGDIGWYAASVMIEDFAVDHPDDALSAVPLQFLVDVFDSESNCDVFPVFIEPNLFACYVLPVGETFNTQLIARSSRADISITEIQTISPVGMKKSHLTKVPGSKTDYYVNVTWTPTADQVGEKILCYYAKDSKKMASDQTCMSLVIIREMVEVNPILSDPAPDTTISVKKSEITIRFSKNITRDTAPAAVKIAKRSGKFLLDIEPATSDLVRFPSDDTKSMIISTKGVEFRGNKKYFLQVFPTASRYNRINSKCVAVGTWSWMFYTDTEHCLKNPCENKALCVELQDGYKCECRPGFQGKNCEEDINECESSPCLNEGECHDNVGSYSCACLPGFTGDNCQIENDECWSLPCLNGASCIDKVDSFECKCADGYIGELCESDVNECDSNPCQNQGYCVDLPGGAFICFCNAGYDGELCEIDVDECASDPCKNGATCVDRADYFQCQCAPGYSGYLCETNIDECNSSPCMNGGSCIDGVDGFICQCVSGYAQPNCQTEINECDSNPCQNSGNCIDRLNSFKCKCKEGFKGKLCQNDRNECYLSPCKNGGTCVNTFGGYECLCESGFIGKNCASNEDDCLLNPCKNGATCIDKVGGATCKCAAGYEGEFCQTDINECVPNACKHGGTCTDQVNGFSCYCMKGYTGNICEIDLDECMSDPCQNGAVCVNQVNAYSCVCAPGFEGLNCEVDLDECLSNPCMYEGTCTDKANGYECICPYYRTGRHCESYVITGWGKVLAAELPESGTVHATPPTNEIHVAEAVCMETYMIVYIAKEFVGDLDPQQVTLTDRNCVGTRHNATHFSIGTAYGKCGTVADEKGTHVIFRNEIHLQHDNELIKNGITLPNAIHIECIMENNADISVNYIPQIDNVIVNEKGYGNLQFGLNMYRDSSYRYTKDEFPADIAVNDRIYFGTRLFSRPQLQLFIERCVASPSNSNEAHATYTFIENGCSLDPTLEFHTSPSTTEVRFSIEALSFVDFDVEPMVYIHCQVKLCDMKNVSSECVPDCSLQEKTGTQLQKRSTEFVKDRTLTSKGGIRIRRNIEEGKNKRSSNGVVVLSLSLTIVVLISIIIGLLFIGNSYIRKSTKNTEISKS